ncbi:hypothetical protein [Catalinimonas niigatensis]|uniref:hypothetical protein n=1 Tax=Catalinimonas niigatensis TaxID=1397264 RepID=UPI0026667207|nr:hypothetical protein [Catalinimonas niigatensis]WPP49964.1 hypothetical protein PZB72_25200 [Catalinimonas niigatensis]
MIINLKIEPLYQSEYPDFTAKSQAGKEAEQSLTFTFCFARQSINRWIWSFYRKKFQLSALLAYLSDFRKKSIIKNILSSASLSISGM